MLGCTRHDRGTYKRLLYWLGLVNIRLPVIMLIVPTYFLNICMQTRYTDKHYCRESEIMLSIITLCRKN